MISSDDVIIACLVEIFTTEGRKDHSEQTLPAEEILSIMQFFGEMFSARFSDGSDKLKYDFTESLNRHLSKESILFFKHIYFSSICTRRLFNFYWVIFINSYYCF